MTKLIHKTPTKCAHKGNICSLIDLPEIWLCDLFHKVLVAQVGASLRELLLHRKDPQTWWLWWSEQNIEEDLIPEKAKHSFKELNIIWGIDQS